jgi:hypothetical protein
VVGRRGNGRREDATSYGQEQWRVGTCNNVLPVFVVITKLFGEIAWPARSPDLTVPDFSLWGFLKDRVFPKAYHDYSRTETSHFGRSCGYWWGPTEARVLQLPDILATMQCNGCHMPDVICRKLACNVWVINSILGHIYRRFRLFFPSSIYYLWPFEMCQPAWRHPVRVYT